MPINGMKISLDCPFNRLLDLTFNFEADSNLNIQYHTVPVTYRSKLQKGVVKAERLNIVLFSYIVVYFRLPVIAC